ncbi:unnamed protein product [Orchesella dallaii]|uniref:Uncharacterized protein n=1 Tax=Orchesella dallaii TaxID=48710 RepID=A0ABP1PXV4_9HEXA
MASRAEKTYEDAPRSKKMRGIGPAQAVFRCKTKMDSADFNAASVGLMQHAPLSAMWGFAIVGLMVEVVNNHADRTYRSRTYWVAKVIKIQGYLLLLRYEGFSNDPTSDFWIHINSREIHHIGWCETKRKKLAPPPSIAHKHNDWKKYLTRRLRGNVSTIPRNLQAEIKRNLKSEYAVGDILEVLDKHNVSQLMRAEVHNIVGRRLHMKYYRSFYNRDFWFHDQSYLVHRMGWAKTVGHKIDGGERYNPAVLRPTVYDSEYEQTNLEEGMMLEAVNPLNPCAIGVGSIMKVLKFGYVMVRLEDNVMDLGKEENGWYCYHITSPYILPRGFCEKYGLPLTPPIDWEEENDFHWESYLIATETRVAPLDHEQMINHGFEVGMKVEAADLLNPEFICPATISNVAGHLLKIHFDEWEEEYDQWVDARSVDIYPVGWCELVEPDDYYNDEEADTVGDASLQLRRGRKQGRRVSGVFREIKSLTNIGQNALVMTLVLSYMNMKNVMEAGAKPTKYLWINWELHFHDELLAGTEQDDLMEGGATSSAPTVIPSIQAILTIVNRAGFNQITHEEAKLPFRQEHVYVTSQDTFIALPGADNGEITTFDASFGMDMAAQSLFIPTSDLFTLKAFSLDILKEEWTEEDIKSKLELFAEDVGPNKKLTTVVLFKYMNNPAMLNFIENFSKSNKTIELLCGEVEEVASNKCGDAHSSQMAAGFSFYAGPGATINVFGVDFSKENAEEILSKMKEQVDSSTKGFCFLITQDGRPPTQQITVDGNDDDTDWSEIKDPEPKRESFLQKLRAFIPKIQLLGVQSYIPLDLVNVKNTNVDDSSKNQFCCGLLILTY